ncbi:MFS transporter [Candidatus Xianfuyuplasma coldseepsis]|uniref:MFS transporter n=1 Tax=Candidatus Xianfuyuplasma coldseepsis TaxID=2782163 RepID=A0A7L7KQW6_9MOLU|nr:MFS transporter [Xianfuyuplasma coldseepsis]QMS85210.1 MFS transporter [Xianfuyuplasma coldseepsis]
MFKHNYIKDKNFLLYFFGVLVSGAGSRIYGFGISLYLLDLTGLATSMSTYISIWTFIVFIVSPVAATFTDRWQNKVRVLYLTDYGRGIVYTLIGIGVYYFDQQGNTDMVLVTIYSLLALIAVQTAFFSPASSALLPQVVHADELVSASSLFQMTRSIQNIIGLAFGAVLYVQFGIVILIFINAISFILSAFSEMFIRYDVAKNQDRLDATAYQEIEVNGNKTKHYAKQVFTDLKEATIYIFKEAKPIAAIVYIIVISLALVEPWFSIGVPYLIKEYLGFVQYTADYILATIKLAEAIGLISMSLIVAVIASKFTIHQLLKFGGAAYVVISTLYIILIRIYDVAIIEEQLFIILFISLNFIAGLVSASFNAPLNAAISRYIDPNKLGKVVTLMDSFGGILFPFAALIAGPIIDHFSVYYVGVAMVVGIIIMSIIIFNNKYIRELQ